MACGLLSAQQTNTDSLRQAILSYDYTGPSEVSHQRTTLLASLKIGDLISAAKAYDSITRPTEIEITPPFYLEEDLLVNLLLGRYEKVLWLASDHKPQNNVMEKEQLYPDLLWHTPIATLNLPAEEYFMQLHELAISQKEQHLDQVMTSTLPAVDKEGFRLIYDYLTRVLIADHEFMTGRDLFEKSEQLQAQNEVLTKHAAAFLKDHPKNPYQPYIEYFIYKPQRLADIGLGFDMTLLTGLAVYNKSSPISTYLADSPLVTFGLDFTYKEYMLQFGLLLAPTDLQRDLVVGGIPWFRDESVSYRALTIDIGYRLQTNRFTFSPFVGLGLNGVYHLNLDEVAELENSRVRSTGGWQCGLNMEFALRAVDRESHFPSLSAPYLKLKALIRDPQLERRQPEFAGTLWSLQLSFGVYLRQSVARDRMRGQVRPGNRLSPTWL